MHVTVNTIIPYPGTKQYDYYNKQGRIVTDDFRLYDGRNVVVKPKKMTVKELEQGYNWFREKYNSPLSFVKRVSSNLTRPKNIGAHFVEVFDYHLLNLKSKYTNINYRN
ncbi:hypothetical protein GF327_02670 [Candidatus Woesearchaeota archaeon]|nr:hypothetical protein [Candidatus Woesearchaeota archaeon]